MEEGIELRTDPFRADRILDFLIQPTPAALFFERHWEAAPLLVEGRDADYYASLLTRDRLAEFLEGDDLRHPPVRLARLGGVDRSTFLASRRYGHVVVGGVIDREVLFREYTKGASIVVDQANEIFPSLGRCAAALQRYMGLRAQASIFLSPPGAQSFPVHFDPHGVFVLQIAGRKIWRLFDRPAPWPLQEDFDPGAALPEHRVALEVELVPGSALYVPRGHYHQVVTTDSDSIHVSLGMIPLTWIDVLRQVIDELKGEVEFREAPVEQVRAVRNPKVLRSKWASLLDRMRDGEEIERVWERLERRLEPQGMRSQRGRLHDLCSLGGIDATTPVRLRSDLDPVSLEPKAEVLRLCFGGKGLTFPPPFEPVLRVILDGRSVCAADLAEWLERDEAVDLVRLLVSEGLLTLAPDDDMEPAAYGPAGGAEV